MAYPDWTPTYLDAPPLRNVWASAMQGSGSRVEVKVFYGLEIRGLMAGMIRDIRIEDAHPGRASEYRDHERFVHVAWVVPSVENGEPIVLSFAGTFPAWPLTDEHDRVLTREQAAIRHALRRLWEHEFQEAVWMDNAPVGKPDDLHG